MGNGEQLIVSAREAENYESQKNEGRWDWQIEVLGGERLGHVFWNAKDGHWHVVTAADEEVSDHEPNRLSGVVKLVTSKYPGLHYIRYERQPGRSGNGTYVLEHEGSGPQGQHA